MYDKELLFQRHPELSPCRPAMEQALALLLTCAKKGGKILLCGNGGSAADCDHISGELLKGFLKKRPLDAQILEKWEEHHGAEAAQTAAKLQNGICAVNLTALAAPISAVINDTDPMLVFAQCVWAMGQPGDVLVGLSTSGNAKNVGLAAQAARERGMSVISLTGRRESPLSDLADAAIRVPAQETYLVQELHLPVYHWLCAAVEDALYEK